MVTWAQHSSEKWAIKHALKLGAGGDPEVIEVLTPILENLEVPEEVTRDQGALVSWYFQYIVSWMENTAYNN